MLRNDDVWAQPSQYGIKQWVEKKIFFLKKQRKSISDWQTRDKDGGKKTLNWMTLVSKMEE